MLILVVTANLTVLFESSTCQEIRDVSESHLLLYIQLENKVIFFMYRYSYDEQF